MKALRIILVLGTGVLGGSTVLLFAAHWWIQRTAARYVIGQLANLPHNHVGLVLGTSAYTNGHHRNPHFQNRIAAAANLFRTHLVKHLLLSGDNGTRGYDEPAEMERSLLALGIPSTSLTRDDAGFRTLDSVVRARKVFELERVTIITDRFHCYRAVFLARHFGLKAIAFPSEEVDLKYSLKSRGREWLADVRACLDVYVWRTQPRFLGTPIRIDTKAAKP